MTSANRLSITVSAVLATIIGTMWLESNIVFIQHAETARGEVLSFSSQRSAARRGYSNRTFRPKYGFTTASGEDVTFRSSLGRGYVERLLMPAGTEVEILYDPKNPERAIANHPASLWLPPTVLLLLGGAGLLVPGLFFNSSIPSSGPGINLRWT